MEEILTELMVRKGFGPAAAAGQIDTTEKK